MPKPGPAHRLMPLVFLLLCLGAPRCEAPIASPRPPPLLDLGLSLGPEALIASFGLSDRAARILVSAERSAEHGLSLACGLSSPGMVIGPLSPAGLCRFLLDPCGEGYRLDAASGRPLELDGSLASSRYGLLLGGRGLGLGAWTGPGLGPVWTLWARERVLGPLEGGFLAQAFGEEAPEERAWVDPQAIEATGPGMQCAYGLGARGAGSGFWLALGSSEAPRGPQSASLRAEATLSLGALALRGAAAARGRDWIVPGGRLGAASMARADLVLGRKERLALGLGALATASEGDASELRLKASLDAGGSAFSLALDAEALALAEGLGGLGADARMAYRRAGLALGLGAGLDQKLGEEAWGLKPAERRRLRLGADLAWRAGALELAAKARAATPEAQGADSPWSLEARIGLDSGLGDVSGELELASDEDGLSWTWSLRWRRRLVLDAQR